MIVMMLSDGLVIGLTNRNMEHLTSGSNPAFLKLHRPLTVQSIMVIRGDTKPDILRQIEAAGVEVPALVKEAAERDPL